MKASTISPWHAKTDNIVSLVDWLLSAQVEDVNEDRECNGRAPVYLPSTPHDVLRIFEKPWRYGSEWMAYVEWCGSLGLFR